MGQQKFYKCVKSQYNNHRTILKNHTAKKAFMSPEQADDLEITKKRSKLIVDRVRSVALGYSTGFFLHGEGGSGKTYTVTNALHDLGSDWILHNSDMTGTGLYEALKERPSAVHVLDDLEQLYRDTKAVGILRAATWGDENGKNRIITKAVHKKNESFEFTGGIIILSNLPLGDLPHWKALATRLSPAIFQLTEGEKKAMMLDIASKGKFGMAPDVCEEVCEYIIFHVEKNGNCPLSLRMLDVCLQDRRMYDNGECETHWKDLVVSRLEGEITEPKIKPRKRKVRLQDERFIAQQVFDMFPDHRQKRFAEWEKRTGKTERSLYRRLEDLGLEKRPKFMSIDDDGKDEEAFESDNLSTPEEIDTLTV